MQDTASWRGDYFKIITKLIAEGATIDAVADRLDMLVDDVAALIDHPLAPILERWRATKPGYGWAALERTN